MFARFFRSLSLSQSLYRSRHSRAIKFILCLIISNNATALPPPPKGYENFGEYVINEVVKNMVEIPASAINGNGAKAVDKAIKNNVFKPEGNGKIETKDSSIRIDTKDAESMRLAAEFRQNYKKRKYCEEPETEEIRIQCVNEYINARQAAINQ